MKNLDDLFNLYNCNIDDLQVNKEVEKILNANLSQNKCTEVYKLCLNCVDLTSLNGTDTEEQIFNLVQKVNKFEESHPGLPNVAAICVYPSLISTVKEHLTEDIGIASVTGGFPASQTFIEIKIAETSLAIMEGATETDTVISIGKFLTGDYETVAEELTEIKSACRDTILKVIIESGALKSAANIKKASILAMFAGADFIKTSTGKMSESATPFAAYVMCQAIKEWHEQTGKKVGYKAAGGISTTEDALIHYTMVKAILGEAWLNNQLFRLGASRLANNLLTDLKGEKVNYF